MLALERRNAILEKLALTGKVIVADLSREFNVTEETIRRDLEKLDNEGLAQKTYGGAVANHSLNIDLPYAVRQRTNMEAKQAIATKVAEQIHDGDFLMLDASSTAIYTAKCIRNKHNITLITNSVEILLELAEEDDWHVISTGGILKNGALELVGTQAERAIRGFHVDVAVCSCKGLDLSFGISDSNERDAQIKQAMYASADRRVLVADHSKFNQTSFVKIGDITDVDIVVTDICPAAPWGERLADAGVSLVY